MQITFQLFFRYLKPRFSAPFYYRDSLNKTQLIQTLLAVKLRRQKKATADIPIFFIYILKLNYLPEVYKLSLFDATET